MSEYAEFDYDSTKKFRRIKRGRFRSIRRKAIVTWLARVAPNVTIPPSDYGRGTKAVLGGKQLLIEHEAVRGATWQEVARFCGVLEPTPFGKLRLVLEVIRAG